MAGAQVRRHRLSRRAQRAAAGGWAVVLLLSATAWAQAEPSPDAGLVPRPVLRNADGEIMLQVVATTTQIADFARNVGGELAHVDAILSANVDPRDFELGPGDLQRIAWADVILTNGVGLDDAWMDPLRHGNPRGIPVEVTAPTAFTPGGARFLPQIADGEGPQWRGFTVPVAVVSRGVQVLPGDRDGSQGDPHIWFAVPNAVQMVTHIRDALAAAAPPYASYYGANAARYIEQLRALDTSVARQVATLPPLRRTFVTNSQAFRYYASRYGLRLVPVEIPAASPEGRLSAQQLAALVARIRAQHIRAIFLDWRVTQTLDQEIGREAGVRVVTGLYDDALGLPGSDGDTYIKMMSADTAMIVSALR
jgi:ABC-type Zn uptake system ZnuABC Zn-binding protein ZnuA